MIKHRVRLDMTKKEHDTLMRLVKKHETTDGRLIMHALRAYFDTQKPKKDDS